MNRQWAVQIFSLLAIVAGALISYFPPAHNAEAAWTLIGSFLGYGIRDLFGPSGLVSTYLSPAVAPSATPPQGGQGGFIRLPLLFLLPLIAAAAVMLSACGTAPLTAAGGAGTTTPTAIVATTPAEIAARVCPAATLTIANLQGLLGLSVETQAKLTGTAAIVSGACSVGLSVNTSNLQTLLASGIPALQDLIRTAGLPDVEANTLLLDISVAQVLLQGFVQPVMLQ